MNHTSKVAGIATLPLAVVLISLLAISASAQTSKDLDYVIFTNLTIGQVIDLRDNFKEGVDTGRRFDSLLFAYISGTRDGMAKSAAQRRGKRADGSFDKAFADNMERCMKAPHPRDIMDELYSNIDEPGFADLDLSVWLHAKLANTDC
jgi:hypothetical protein